MVLVRIFTPYKRTVSNLGPSGYGFNLSETGFCQISRDTFVSFLNYHFTRSARECNNERRSLFHFPLNEAGFKTQNTDQKNTKKH